MRITVASPTTTRNKKDDQSLISARGLASENDPECQKNFACVWTLASSGVDGFLGVYRTCILGAPDCLPRKR